MSPLDWIKGAALGVLGFALKHWVWFALAAALWWARQSGIDAAEKAAALTEVTRQRDEATVSAKAWEEHAKKAQQLQEATLQARAQEQSALISIARALGATKQGIANAPGADDTFRYSDALHGFMQQRPEEPASPAGQAPADVGGR